ncbi:MAG: hypothetical protein RR051_07300, partial [Clostridiales bacterium]
RLDNAASIAKGVQIAQDALQGGSRGNSSLELIWEAKCQIEKLSRSDSSLAELLQQVTESYYNLEDVAEQLRGYGSNIVDDPG